MRRLKVLFFVAVLFPLILGSQVREFVLQADERITAGCSGDLNSDGKEDFFVLAYNKKSFEGKVYAENGKVIFSADGHTFEKMIIVDLNNDGQNDFLLFAPSISTSPGQVLVFYGPLDSKEIEPNFCIVGNHPDFGENGAVGDLDNDGKKDIVVMSDDRMINIYSINQLTPKTTILFENRFSLSSLEVGDIDLDHDDDLIVGLPLGTDKGIAYFFRGPIVNGTLTAKDADCSLEGRNKYEQLGAHLQIIDDGLVVSSNNYVQGYHEGGSMLAVFEGKEKTKELIVTNDSILITSLSYGDVNNDGIGDLVVGAPFQNGNKGNVYILFGPDYSFDIASSISGINDREATGYFTTIGDYDGDGKTDLAVGFLGFRGEGLELKYSGGVRIFYNMMSSVAEYNTATRVITAYNLNQNYPNPFNPETRISYSIAKAGHVKLAVYNVLGQKVADLVDEYKAANSYKVTLDASNLTSGVYFYRLEVGEFSKTMKMMLTQ